MDPARTKSSPKSPLAGAAATSSSSFSASAWRSACASAAAASARCCSASSRAYVGAAGLSWRFGKTFFQDTAIPCAVPGRDQASALCLLEHIHRTMLRAKKGQYCMY